MDWTAVGALFVGTAVSGVVPLVNAELLVVGAAVLAPAAALPLLAAVSAAGQMTTKIVLYGVARRAPSSLPVRARAALERGAERVRGHEGATRSTVLASAILGVPPFYGVSLACGALRIRFASFAVPGFLGRCVRFGALAWLAGLGV